MGLVKISSGLDNISDWIYIFTIKRTYMEYGFESYYYYEFYCNLHKNSSHYKKFALNSYVDMLGDEIKIIKESSLEEILKKYNN